MEINLIAESVKFMFLGMGVVFAFLTIMIFVLKDTKSQNETAKIAAIIAAVQHHKNLKG